MIEETKTEPLLKDSKPGAMIPMPAWAPFAVALVVPLALFFFVPPLSKSGLWDPYELNVADLSRRIALNLFGASSLALSNADNTLPHLNDLGRPQLPFSSIAIGFRVFGLHEWAGRFPLALWGLLGVLATYAFVARLFDKRTGAYAAVALSTMPVYFVQARSMMGDVCAMAGLAMALGGLAVAVFDRELVPSSPGEVDGLRAGRAVAPPLLRRVPWLLMGGLGLAVGFESRGGLLGLAVPCVAVGLAWGTSRVAASPTERDAPGDALGAVCLLAGLGVVALAVRASWLESKDLDLWLGALVHVPGKYPTFDFYVGAIGHSLAPWSAFLPFAFGRLMLAPVLPNAAGGIVQRESCARLVILMGAAAAFVAHAWLASTTDLIVFTGAAVCAVACAVAIRDFERGAHPSIAVGIGTLILAAVLHHDFHELPEKAYQAFGIASATFPESFKNTALNIWWVVLGGFALCAFLTWAESDADRTPFDPASFARVLRALREAYDGGLALAYLALVAGASVAGFVLYVGGRTHAHWLPQMSSSVRDLVLNLWWVVAFVPLGAAFAVIFVSDLWLWTFSGPRWLSTNSLTRGFEPFEALFGRLAAAASAWKVGRLSNKHAAVTGPVTAPAVASAVTAEVLRAEASDRDDAWIALVSVAALMLLAIPAGAFALGTSFGLKPLPAALVALPSGVALFLAMGITGDLLRHRAPGLALGGALAGFVLCFSYYPALANQLSPKEVFESYRQVCPDAPLGLLGVGGRTSAYYAGGQPQVLSDPAGAYQWLTAGGSQRRCMALKAEELPKLNQLWREHGAGHGGNLPIVDARSSQILLAASSLGSDQKNQNPLSEIVLAEAPHPQRKLGANMEDKLEVIGIDLDDERGRAVEAVSPGRTYHFKTYYRVLAPVTTEWEGFIHIDGYHRRHNGDHKPTNGKYPMSMWLPGDFVLDDHEFKLEPNFTPGTYTIYFGLFAGDTRLKVTSGPNDGDNRINGGPLRVQ
ncbi:MAG: glycosyltransferase family 39 protein [Polyangiaceae bacterium]